MRIRRESIDAGVVVADPAGFHVVGAGDFG
jgi:hypothetical protein